MKYAYYFPDQFIYPLKDFKNSFQQLYVYFIIANARKITSPAIQPGRQNIEGDICLTWCSVIGKKELLTPSVN